MKRETLHLAVVSILVSIACTSVAIGIEKEPTLSNEPQPPTEQLTVDETSLPTDPRGGKFTNSTPPSQTPTSGTSLCELKTTQPLATYAESSPSAEVSGTVETGAKAVAIAHTQDGWIAFGTEPTVAKEDRTRLTWLNAGNTGVIFEPPGCQESLPLILSLTSLDNSTYYINNTTEVTLVNGEYENANADTSSLQVASVQRGTSIGFGDMDGDDDEDAMIALWHSLAGTGRHHMELAVVLNDNGIPRHLTSVSIFGREEHEENGFSIADGILAANLVVYGPDDALAGPTQQVTWHYQLIGDELVCMEDN